ncbi:MAG: DUF4926 domain-containing protein [Sideroxydans sp.]|nr:DUF4926 domain-containing protein [Sideroxydans sp.]
MSFQLFDVVVATESLPEAGIRVGMRGVIVDIYSDGEYEVEFCNNAGETLAMAAMRRSQLVSAGPSE